MIASTALDSVTVPLSGINLVEAAAGTGKTYNIQNLVARLILERQLKIDEIVILSFTNEAAAELSRRCRQILDDILSLLEDVPVAKPEQALAVIEHDRQIAPERDDRERCCLVRNALRDFDLSNISTINGFCQKLLSNYAFESNQTFNARLETDYSRLLMEILEDWMRNKLYAGGDDNKLVSALVSSYDIKKLESHILDFNLTIPECQPDLFVDELEKLIRMHEEFNEFESFRDEVFRKNSAVVTHRKRFAEALEKKDYETILELVSVFTPEKLEKSIPKTHQGTVGSSFQESEFFVQCRKIDGLRDTAVGALKCEAIRFARERFAELQRKGNFMTFADQIRLVDEALQKSSGLKAVLQKKFKAGIIDEFQDTDVMQYRIFSNLFCDPDSCVFLVGDPRQAIYSFRGGDINAYLLAKQEISETGKIYHLSVNYRSSVNMVAAVNAIFANRDKPFGNIDIDFPELEARSPEKAPELLENGHSAPHAFIRNILSSGNATHLLFGCAKRIFDLISPESTETMPDGRPIVPGDIAVLLRSNAECVQMQNILEMYNIPAVCLKCGNVYGDIEAYSLYQVLRGVLEPSNHKKVSAALATFLCNVPLAELDMSVAKNAVKISGYMEHFRKMSSLWYQQGFPAMFEYFLKAFNVRENLASRSDGERRLTNLYQLSELLHAKAASSQMPPMVLTDNFGDLIARSDDPLYKNDEHEELMSSGDSSVRIMTIHAAKGLQFPVVLLPGVQKLTRPQGWEFKDVFFNGSSRELNIFKNPVYKERESKDICEEKIRLIYVALTRAEYRCETFESMTMAESVWSDLLAPVLENLHSKTLELPQSGTRRTGMAWDLVPDVPEIPDVSLQWQLTSYSALTRNIAYSGNSGSGNSPVDHDENGESSGKSKKSDGDNKNDFSPFALSGGAGFGTTLHEIFERIDFAGEKALFENAAVTLLRRSGNQELCRQQKYPAAVANWLYGIFHTALPDGYGNTFTLSEIPEKDRLVELEFYCNMTGFDLNDLRSAVDGYMTAEFGPVDWRSGWERVFPGGIFNGFIDLVFRRGGKYYIVDWKSNSLSGDPKNFQPGNLPEAMKHSFYFLQYLFYLVALVRHLRHFNNGVFGEFEYENMIGGVYYLFVRGISPQHPGRGVFQTRPSWQVIQKLEELTCVKMM